MLINMLRNLGRIGVLVETLSEIRMGIRDIETDLSEVKCELARQGEELDLLYAQHNEIIKLSHDSN